MALRKNRKRGQDRSRPAEKEKVTLRGKVSGDLGDAVRHHRAGRFKKAESGYREILRHFPDDVDVLCNLGAVLHGQGRLAEAEVVLRHARACDPRRAPVHFNLGNTLKGLGRIDEAADAYLEAVSLNPRHGAAHFNLGNILFMRGEFDSAVERYRAVLACSPDHPGALMNLGNVLKKMGKLDESLSMQRRLLEIDPDNAAVHYNAGIIHKALNRTDEALQSFRRAVDLDPGNENALINLAHILKDRGDTAEARACFQRVLDINPAHESAKHLMAALTGTTTEAAPRAYVESLYDGHAHEFENLLVEKLEYRVPSILRRLVDDVVGRDSPFANALDMGCGTGLAGVAFRSCCERITGIDLSAEMVARAEKKDLYDRLEVRDFSEYLAVDDERYDLFLATDVFIYTGNLAPVFSLVRRCARAGACLAFSTERCEGESFLLRPTGRYAHSIKYIEGLAADHAFAVDLCRPAVIRKEGGRFIEGDLYVLRALCSR